MAEIRISTLRGGGGSGGEGGANAISLEGPSLVLQGTTNTFTITNYDDFSEYTVVTSVGTISRDGDTITLVVPPDAGDSTIGMGVTRNGSTRVFQLGLGTISVVTPSIVSPQEGATGVPTSTTFQSTPFSTAPVGMGAHLSSEWQVARDLGFTDIVASETVVSGNMTRSLLENLPRLTKLYARVRYTSEIGTSSWSTPVGFTTTEVLINKPIVSIVGTDFDVKEPPKFNSSVFSVTPAGGDTHVASTWVLRKEEDDSVVWQLQASTSSPVRVTVPRGVLEESQAYTMEVQHIGSLGTSVFSNRLTFITAREFVPDEPGTPFGGGYYAGRMRIEGQLYALIVAPKTQGGESPTPLQHKTADTSTPGASSRDDGWANTQAMIAAGARNHPAANWCNNLTINGYNDWYLPAINETEILYRNFKPTSHDNRTGNGANPISVPPSESYTLRNPSQTSLADFREGGVEAFTASWYWSSTGFSTQYGLSRYFSHGLSVSSFGTAYPPRKTSSGLVRAVRRVAIEE